VSSKSHNSTHIHHKFTIKKPRLTTHFLQKPLEKHTNHPAKNVSKITSVTYRRATDRH
jgi:hypothetical protein